MGQSQEQLFERFSLLNFRQSVQEIDRASLTPAQKYLTQLILSQGRSYMVKFAPDQEPVPILDVTRFLNHRADGKLISHLRRELGSSIQSFTPDVLLTAATSGIIPAIAAASHQDNGNISVVFARKGDPPLTMEAAGVHKVDSRSYTSRGRPVSLIVAKDCLLPHEITVIMDEFLDFGVTTAGLSQIVASANAQLAGCVFVIEKESSGGREFLKQQLELTDAQIISLLVIEGQGEGWMKIKDVDKILTFNRQ